MNIKKKEITKEKLRILEKNENKNEGKEFENDGQQEKTKISLKKNKSKICAQNEENEEKEGVPYESEEINIGTISDFKLEVDSSINNSKCKKSKTLNKKKVENICFCELIN